jgi:hypothetical protein
MAMRAFAEFVVIVIGVLVALGLENWANDQAARVAEVDYLQALVADIRTDSAVWTNIHRPVLARSKDILEGTIPIAAGARPIPDDTASFLRDVSGSPSRPFIIGTGPTYEELLATGSLRLIESAEVRSAIVGYYQEKRVAQLRSESSTSGLNGLVEGVLPRRMGGGGSLFLGSSPGGAELLGEVFSVDAALEAIVSTEFARAMGQELNYVAVIASTVDTLLERALGLIQLIDQEVERLT